MEKYFEKCLNSIVNQTFQDLEIILIDDCGNDSSIKIAERFAQNDNRIKIIRNEKNKGQGYSRNLGIKQARGDYIAFVDSDDWLELDMYEKLYAKAKETDVDIVKCSFRYVFKSYSEPYPLHYICQDFSKVYNVYDAPDHILGRFITTVWNGLYRKSFIKENNIRFIETKFEDMLFCWETRIKAKSIAFIEDVFYNYLKTNPNSDTKTLEYFYCFLDNCSKLKQLVVDKPEFYRSLFIYSVGIFQFVYKSLRHKDKKTAFFKYQEFLSLFDQSFITCSSFSYACRKRLKYMLSGNYYAYKYYWVHNIGRFLRYVLD